MNPLIIVGLAIAGFAAWQQSQKKPDATGAGGTTPLPKDDKPAAGESTESKTTDGKTVVVTTVDGTADIKPTTDKSSTVTAGAATRAEPTTARVGVQTAPAPVAAGAGVRAATGAMVGAIPNPFARVGAAAYSGLVTSTYQNTSARYAVQELTRLGPSVGALW